MREFFRGSRRKIGLTTLLTACVFMAGWVRSTFKFDLIHRVSETSFFFLTSNDGILMWSSGTGHDFWPSFTWVSREPFAFHWQKYNGDFPLLKLVGWQYLEVHTVGPDGALSRNSGHYIRYGSIVIPLTAISLWLLLTKPRRSPPVDSASSYGDCVESSREQIRRQKVFFDDAGQTDDLFVAGD